MPDIPQINQQLFDKFFRDYRKIALVFVKASKTKIDDFDPFRDTGYNITNQNPLSVKVIVKTIAPSSLVFKELGLTHAGAIQIILNNRDVTLIQNAVKILIENIEYYVYDDAVGSKFQIFPTEFADMSKIILFRKQV